MDSATHEKFPNHSSLLDPSFGIPTDVTFQIMGFKNLEIADGLDREVLLGEVKGHKLILVCLAHFSSQERVLWTSKRYCPSEANYTGSIQEDDRLYLWKGD